MVIKFNSRYLVYSIVFFTIEVLIAFFVNDKIIRPYGGDFLVVILLYCLIKSILIADSNRTALFVLVFAYVIETLQYFNIVGILGLGHYTLANVIIGTSFAWLDMIAYTLGVLTVLIAEWEY